MPDSGYPRTYRPAPVWMVLSLSLAAAAPIVVYSMVQLVPRRGQTEKIFFAIFMAFFVLGGAYSLLVALRSRIVLHADRMEVRECWRTHVYFRDDFSGWRTLAGRGPAHMVFLPREEGKKQVTILQIYRLDKTFIEWLPNLDEQDYLKSQEEIVADPEIGSAPEERLEKLTTARRLARWLNWVALAACIWGITYPRPYILVASILACLPWVAIWAAGRSRGLFRIGLQTNDAHPDPSIPIVLSTLALGISGIQNAPLLNQNQSIAPGCIIGGVLFLAAVAADRALAPKAGSKIALLVIAVIYGLGAGMSANALLDRSPATTYTATVIAKAARSLLLTPWGQERSPNNISVSREISKSVQQGDLVCIDVKPGALRMRWYTVRRCR